VSFLNPSLAQSPEPRVHQDPKGCQPSPTQALCRWMLTTACNRLQGLGRGVREPTAYHPPTRVPLLLLPL
jgi:hypothetical protein